MDKRKKNQKFGSKNYKIKKRKKINQFFFFHSIEQQQKKIIETFFS